MKTALLIFVVLYGVVATFHIITMHMEKRKKRYETLHPVVERMNTHGHKIHIVSAVGIVITHPTFLEAAKEFTMHMTAGLVHTH